MKHHDFEAHLNNSTSSLTNWLRAAVLGANDGIVSVSGLIIGVAGATSDMKVILTAGVAGIISGAISMAAGEYVSVSASRDTEAALLIKEKKELKDYPEHELEELAYIYEKKGLTRKTALMVAKELTDHDAFKAHAEAEHRIDPNDLTNPWHAAFASALAFLTGASVPLIAIILAPNNNKIFFTVSAVLLSLALTGYLSAKTGGADIKGPIFRVVLGGALAMAITYFIGKIFGVEGI